MSPYLIRSLGVAVYLIAHFGLTAEAQETHGRDPLDLVGLSPEQDTPEHRQARQAAMDLRVNALADLDKRREVLRRDGDVEGLQELGQHLATGNLVYDLEPEIGVAKLIQIDHDLAVKVTLADHLLPSVPERVFLLFDVTKIAPDPKEFERWFRELGELEQVKNLNLSGDPKDSATRLEWLREVGGALQEVHPQATSSAEVNSLAMSSENLHRYLAWLRLEQDVQALGLQDSEPVYEGRGERPPWLSKEYRSLWWKAKYEKMTGGSAAVGMFFGVIQAGATFWLSSEAVESWIGPDGTSDHFAFFPLRSIPYIAAAWSWAYGFAIGAYNGFYQNIIYSGGSFERILKHSVFSLGFSYMYKLLTSPASLIFEQGHILTSLFFKQYSKDFAYAPARIRAALRQNHRDVPIPIPQSIQKLSDRIPAKLAMNLSHLETQACYHILWLVNMAYFEKLIPFEALPTTVVAFGAVSYLYLYASMGAVKKQLASESTPERRHLLKRLKKQKSRLDGSWFGFLTEPTSWMYRKISSRLAARSSVKPREAIPIATHEDSAKGKDGSATACTNSFQGASASSD